MQSGNFVRSRTGIVALAALGAIGAAFSGPARSDSTPGEDARTEARVKDALHSDAHLLSRHINVSVRTAWCALEDSWTPPRI